MARKFLIEKNIPFDMLKFMRFEYSPFLYNRVTSRYIPRYVKLYDAVFKCYPASKLYAVFYS